jgi:hypothetical protein
VKKYLVTRTETWTWQEEFEAENEDDLAIQIDEMNWEISDSNFDMDCEWEEIG